MLSILIPTYGAGDFLAQCVQSLYANTKNDFILHVVDDASGPETQEYIATLQKKYGFKLTQLNKRKYVNPIWNMAESLTKGRYVAIINNDITFSKGWDHPLIEALQVPDVWLANPYQTDEGCKTPYAVTGRTNGLSIRGSGFMMRRDAMRKIFPIPQDLLIWFGDNWIVRQVEKNMKKSVFVPESVIHHYGSRSSTQFQNEHGTMYWICRGDAYAYQCVTGEDNRRWIDEVMARL